MHVNLEIVAQAAGGSRGNDAVGVEDPLPRIRIGRHDGAVVHQFVKFRS